MVEKILAGEKTQTRRVGERRWEEGHIYAVQPGRGEAAVASIRVVAVQEVPVVPISLADVRAEGFRSRDEFYARWRALHGAYPGGRCWRLTFELAA